MLDPVRRRGPSGPRPTFPSLGDGTKACFLNLTRAFVSASTPGGTFTDSVSVDMLPGQTHVTKVGHDGQSGESACLVRGVNENSQPCRRTQP